MAKIVEIHWNIFDSNCDFLVNAVNCVWIMGKWIALEFKTRYPDMFNDYKIKCQDNLLNIWQLLIYKWENKTIINFPTKKHWKDLSSISIIESWLKTLLKNYKEYGLKSIAFPQLWTSLGWLDRNLVKERMYYYLNQMEDVYIEIYSFNKESDDALFNKLIIKLNSLNSINFKNEIWLKEKEAKIFYRAFKDKTIKNMNDIHKINWITTNWLKKIYIFAKEYNHIDKLKFYSTSLF